MAVNKMDLDPAGEKLKAVREKLDDTPVFGISALDGRGLNELKWALLEAVKKPLLRMIP